MRARKSERRHHRTSLGLILFLLALTASAGTRYVDLNNPFPVWPYTNWSTAANVIQDAIDAADPFDTIIVSDGVYRAGGRLAPLTSGPTNRVMATKSLSISSVNGPAVTSIEGYQVPGTTNAQSAVRCVYMKGGSKLVGFTLTNGATSEDYSTYEGSYGGGAFCRGEGIIISNCVFMNNSAAKSGGAAYNSGYSSISPAAANTPVEAASGTHGASGLDKSAVDPLYVNCAFLSNSAKLGGAVYGGTIRKSLFSGNSAWEGGAANSATLINCMVVNNWATNGGGCSQTIISSSVIVSNTAVLSGGGAVPGYLGWVRNCTIVGNTASSAGGAGPGLVDSSIIYYNSAKIDPNYASRPPSTSEPNHCCTYPLPVPNWWMNFTNPPLLSAPELGDFTLRPDSPCINAGDNAFTRPDPDMAGNPRFVAGTTDVGAYEFQSPSSPISYAWLQKYALPTDGSADYLDPDGDGMNNWQEWRCSTDPTDPSSALRILSTTKDQYGVLIIWQGVDGRSYSIHKATDLTLPHPFVQIHTNAAAMNGIGLCGDPGTNDAAFFRVSVDDVPSP